MCECFAKYFLFLFNLVFVLVGIAVVGLGIVINQQVNFESDQIPPILGSVDIFVIGLGCIVFLISFFGCCGAIRESRCMLILYAVCMLILAAAKIFVTVVIFRILNNVRSYVEDWLQEQFDIEPLGGPFNALEHFFSCCGTTGAGAYTNQNLPIPPTCCASPIENTCAGADTYSDCNTIVADFLSIFGSNVGFGLIVIIVVELVAMAFALFLNHSVTRKKQQSRVYY